MIRILTCIALATGGWLAVPQSAHAAESYDNCTGFIDSLPATITTQGTWCLKKDLATSMSSGDAITIAANNVTLDCNHFKIGGLGAGASTGTIGVWAGRQLNVTVRNCNIRGFYFGVYFHEGSGHLIEDNRFDRNTAWGIAVDLSPGSTIRNNLIIDTGGSTLSGSARGIYADNGVDILDNTINGVAPTIHPGRALGIHTFSNGRGLVSGNRVRGLVPAGTGAPFGIYNSNSGQGVFRDNDVQGPGPSVAGGIGIYCDGYAATARDNLIAGFEAGISDCLSSSNVVNPN